MCTHTHPAPRIAFLALAWLLFSAPSPQGVLTVVMVPFQTPSSSGLDYIAKSMTTLLPARIARQGRISVIDASTLKKPLSSYVSKSEQRMREAARKLNADFILDGTVGRHDAGIDVSVRLIEVSPPGTVSRLFMRAAMLDNLIPETDTLAASLREIILRNAPVPAARTAPMFHTEPAAPAAPAQLPVQARPRPDSIREEALSETDIPAPEDDIGHSQPQPLFELTPFMAQSFRSATMQTVAAADSDGDGRCELVITTSGAIAIYTVGGTALALRQEITVAAHERIIDVSAGDLNGNGLDELYVTCRAERVATSFVLEKSGSGFTRLTPAMPWFFRVYDDPSGELVLLGQKASGTVPAPGELYRLHWQDGTLRRGHRISPPEGLNIYAFTGADFTRDGRPACLGFVPAGSGRAQLSLYCPAGRIQWRDPREPGFSPRTFQRSNSSFNPSDAIPLRIICSDIDRDGIPDILTAKNSGDPGGRHTGRLVCMHWDGYDMSAAWSSPEFDARISDYTLADLDNDGSAELYVLSVASAGLFGRVTSTITGFRQGR